MTRQNGQPTAIVPPVVTPNPDAAVRSSARVVVNREMAKRLPGANVAPYTDCVLQNATTAELADIAQSADASGAVASVVCFFAVTVVKPKLGYDDSLDVFGVHCVGGIIGALGTGKLRGVVAALRGAQTLTGQHDDRRRKQRLGGAQGAGGSIKLLERLIARGLGVGPDLGTGLGRSLVGGIGLHLRVKACGRKAARGLGHPACDASIE